MDELTEEALRTYTVEGGDASRFLPDDAVLLVAELPADDRGGEAAWAGFCSTAPDRLAVLNLSSPDTFSLTLAGTTKSFRLRNCAEAFEVLPTANCYIDISGLPLQIWGPLIRAGRTHLSQLVATYAEPREYRRHPTPTSTAFDLSTRIEGIRPLPGFVKLAPEVDSRDSLLVVFLGFEGGRARHIAAQFDPLPRTVAVVGLPGYKYGFPQHTVAMNVSFLEQTGSHETLRLAAANSPFEAAGVLKEIVRAYGPKHTLVAPVGTKPHALGCLLYCLDHWDTAELYYDHPIPSVGRSTGIERVHFYFLKP